MDNGTLGGPTHRYQPFTPSEAMMADISAGTNWAVNYNATVKFRSTLQGVWLPERRSVGRLVLPTTQHVQSIARLMVLHLGCEASLHPRDENVRRFIAGTGIPRSATPIHQQHDSV